MNDQLLEFTKSLISIPSTKENPDKLQEVLDVVKKELAEFKFKEFSDAGIPSLLFYNTPELPEKFKIILNAHLDVVPGQPDQFIPKIEGDKLMGRGACDMKSGAVGEILAFKDLATKVNYPLGLQLVTDEEVGGFHGTQYQIKQGVKADFVIAGESTDLALNNDAKGVFWLRITSHGVPAHAAYPWNGKNAIWEMIDFLNKLQQTFPVPNLEKWLTTANLSHIENANTTFNKVPDDCTVLLDIRYIPTDSETIVNTIKNLLPQDFTLEIVTKEPCQHTDQNNPYLKSLAKSITQITQKPTEFIQKHGASDIRHYDGAGMSGVCFGPTGSGLHSDNESGSIQGLTNYHRILTDFLRSL
jgi:succinyl-diaminopimelate desuccinylase